MVFRGRMGNRDAIRTGQVTEWRGCSVKEFASAFYSGKTWQDTRNAYKKYKHGLCELCLMEGKYNSGEIVHHRIPLSPDNINNPSITLDWSNLQLLCREHHSQIHDRRKRRYKIDDMGRVTPL